MAAASRPAVGALLVNAWPGAVLLLGGLVAGKAAHQTGLGGFVAEVALAPVLAITHGSSGALGGRVRRGPDAREAR